MDKSYNIDDLKNILLINEFYIISQSPILIREVFEKLDSLNLIPGRFISEMGILDLTHSNESIKTIEEIDQDACRGIQSIEKSKILVNYIYSTNKCPFCKSSIMIDAIVNCSSTVSLMGGITLVKIKPGSQISYHKLQY